MSAQSEGKWNNEAHSALCGALTDALFAAGSAPAKHKDEILSHLATKGLDFTWEGIRQHLQKLRRKDGAGPAAKGGDPATPKGGKKRGAPASGKKSTGKRGAKSKATAEEDEDDEETPSKKLKTEPKLKKEPQEYMHPGGSAVKDEEEDGI